MINETKKSIPRLTKIDAYRIIGKTLDTNPMQVFNFSNCNADGGSNVNSVQNVYQIDAELVAQLKEILPSLNELVKKIDERNR